MYREQIVEICEGISRGFADKNQRRVALKGLERTLKLMGDYVAAVNNMENAVAVARFCMEPQEYRDHVQELDRSRRITHDALIARITATNRVCDAAGCEKLYSGDISDRTAIADFSFEVVREVFANRNKARRIAGDASEKSVVDGSTAETEDEWTDPLSAYLYDWGL